MRLAHFSDIHVTKPPAGAVIRHFAGKRLAAALNYYVGGRRHRFAQVDRQIERLLEDVDRQRVDHILCTGDVTQMALDSEFARCAELFGERLAHPERYTVLPGNHDRYTRGAVRTRRFERYLGAVASPTGDYPYVKSLPDGVTLVVLDVSRACSLIDSSGLCGARQLDETRALLTDPSLDQRFVVVALHYPLLDEDGGPHRTRHGVRDWKALLEVIDADSSRVDLVVHGHVHRHYLAHSRRRTFACAGSATDLKHAGYQVFEIDAAARTWKMERRVWSAPADAYERDETVPLDLRGGSPPG